MFRAVVLTLLVRIAATGCLRSQAMPQIAKLEDVLGDPPVRYSRELVADVRAAATVALVVLTSS